MCGISGIITSNNQPVEEASIRRMMQIQKHRGPDDEGIFLERNVGLGFVRLSIIDLSAAGHQPMFFGKRERAVSNFARQDDRYVIVFNGEIFNYIELRADLETLGYTFNTRTDTEVLLAAYSQWGEDCLHRFNGMWAFVIYDRQEKKIFASRDRYGIKPFYYYLNDDLFAFASEIPPLLSLLPGKPTIDKQTMFDYIAFNRTDQTERTFFSEIKKLQHGHSLTFNTSQSGSAKENKSYKESIRKSIRGWYNLKERASLSGGFNSSEEFRYLFRSSVGLRLRSDVPVGVCLSGGLDSSSIVSVILNDFRKKDLQTFSVIFGEDIKTDERRFMKLYKEKVHKQHYTEIDAHTYEKHISNFVTAMGEPVPSGGPFAQFSVMRIAKGNAVVLLNGQGADEILGGYKYFWGYYFNELIRKFRIIELLREIRNGDGSLYKLSTSLFYSIPPSLRTNLRTNSMNGFIAGSFKKEYSQSSTLADDLYTANSLQQALYKHVEYKLEHLLKWEDRNSMWFGLESRVPFLDFRIVEKALATKSSLLMKDGYTKNILRDAMKGDLPAPILARKEKVGFGAPQHLWFRQEFITSKIEEALYDHKALIEQFFDYREVQNQLKQHKSGKKDYSNNIWKIYNCSLWMDKYL